MRPVPGRPTAAERRANPGDDDGRTRPPDAAAKAAPEEDDVGDAAAGAGGDADPASPEANGEALDGPEPGDGPVVTEPAEDTTPFHPHWQGGLQFSHEGEERGTFASDLWTASATRAFTEAGTALTLSAGAGRALAERAYHDAWEVGLAGSLGFEHASPSAETTFGATGTLEQHAGASLGVDVPLLEHLDLSLSAGGEARTRSDVLELLFGDSDVSARIRSYSLTGEVELAVEVLSWLTVSPSYAHAWNTASAAPKSKSAPTVVERSGTDLFGLSLGIAALRPLTLELGGQLGWDHLPQNAPINPRTGLPTRGGHSPSNLLVSGATVGFKLDL